MGKKIITFCDGCGIELKEVKERHYMVLKTNRYLKGTKNTYCLKTIELCMLCAKGLEKILKRIGVG